MKSRIDDAQGLAAAKKRRGELMDEVIVLLDKTAHQGGFLWWRRGVLTPRQARQYYRAVHEIEDLGMQIHQSAEYQALRAKIEAAARERIRSKPAKPNKPGEHESGFVAPPTWVRGP